ncbi:hypothetical protein VCHC57A2_3840, partial [Vibrio cholerae HC-57A2]
MPPRVNDSRFSDNAGR